MKNWVVGVIKLTKGDYDPANRVANKQAAAAARAAVRSGQPATTAGACVNSAEPASLSSKDIEYLHGHAEIIGELRHMEVSAAGQDHGDARWLLLCDASPRGLMPRTHLLWAHTGSVTFATWWEVVKFDGLVYVLRGLRSLRELTILRNVMAVLRISCRGVSTLGRPAFVPTNLPARAVRACVAYEDMTPVVAHRHSAHVPIHLVRLICDVACLPHVLTCFDPYSPVLTSVDQY